MSRAQSAEKMQKQFRDAALKLQAGDIVAARRSFEKLVKAAPKHPLVNYNLALAYQHSSMHSKAAKHYRVVLQQDSANIDAQVNLAISLKELGELTTALKHANQALATAPDHPRALNIKATIAIEQEDSETAGKVLAQAIQQHPQDNDIRYNLAGYLLQTGELDDALKTISPIYHPQQSPRNVKELVVKLYIAMKRYQPAKEVIDQLFSEYPDDAEVIRLSMQHHEGLRDYFAILDITEKLLEKLPRDASVWNARGSAFFQLDGIRQAQECYEKAVKLDPEHAEYVNNLGLCYSSQGRKDDAEKCYRKTISLKPMHAEAYRNLVAMKRFKSLDDADAQVIEKLWIDYPKEDDTKLRLSFALGKVYDDCGEYDKAFATYQLGNRLKSEEVDFDFQTYFEHIDRMASVFDKAPSLVNNQTVSPQPIFVMGMPRSGTTLVEQILSRHPDVTGCGELPCVERSILFLERKTGENRLYPDDFTSLTEELLATEADRFIEWVGKMHDIETAYFTDKMPFNFVHAWLIHSMFPQAAIINCLRHPLDVITSNYFQLYGSEINFVYDLEVLARYYIRYNRLTKHWQQIMPDAVIQSRYEALVSDHEAETKRLVASAKLPWNDACLDQKVASNAVRTASIWQVRQGIYTRSKARWRHYEQQLQPAIDILQGEGILDAELNHVI